MTPNHYQNHRENHLRREACDQWSGQIQAALKPRSGWQILPDREARKLAELRQPRSHRLNASAREIDAERSKRQGVPRQELSRGEQILQCVVLGLVVVAVAHAITGPWWP